MGREGQERVYVLTSTRFSFFLPRFPATQQLRACSLSVFLRAASGPQATHGVSVDTSVPARN